MFIYSNFFANKQKIIFSNIILASCIHKHPIIQYNKKDTLFNNKYKKGQITENKYCNMVKKIFAVKFYLHHVFNCFFSVFFFIMHTGHDVKKKLCILFSVFTDVGFFFAAPGHDQFKELMSI